MGYFPFFIEIEEKDGLIVGGGNIAAHKIEKLKPFHPRLTVIAPKIGEEIKKDTSLVWKERRFSDEDVEGMSFVIAATDDEKLNKSISDLCKRKRILVNVVDKKEACNFLFPSLVKEGKLTVGISTEGASPSVSAKLRSDVASAIPADMEEILDFLQEIRIVAKNEIKEKKARTAFLKEAAEICLKEERLLSESEVQKLLEGSGSQKRNGCVTLVGAGCGSYDMITLKGLRAVRQAEVLVYDDLLDERLLSHVSESCKKIYVGKRLGKHSKKQEEINEILIKEALEGKNVVRLKGGDPFVFGRGGEEALALKDAGILVREIPGITSAIALPAGAGIPVTHRLISRSFHVITAHTADTENGLPKDMEYYAKQEGTLVFLMGLSHIEEITKCLIRYGKDDHTPAAVIHGNFDGTELVLRATLGDIADKVKEAEFQTPAIIVVGETAGMQLY